MERASRSFEPDPEPAACGIGLLRRSLAPAVYRCLDCGIFAHGKDMARDAKYFRLATRICAELGAHQVKTYSFEDGFETETSCCPVPIVLAGGTKLPELGALRSAENAIQRGAAGVDLGRNILQSASRQGSCESRSN